LSAQDLVDWRFVDPYAGKNGKPFQLGQYLNNNSIANHGSIETAEQMQAFLAAGGFSAWPTEVPQNLVQEPQLVEPRLYRRPNLRVPRRRDIFVPSRPRRGRVFYYQDPDPLLQVANDWGLEDLSPFNLQLDG